MRRIQGSLRRSGAPAVFALGIVITLASCGQAGPTATPGSPVTSPSPAPSVEPLAADQLAAVLAWGEIQGTNGGAAAISAAQAVASLRLTNQAAQTGRASLVTMTTNDPGMPFPSGTAIWVVAWVQAAPGVGLLEKQLKFAFVDANSGQVLLESDLPCGLGVPC